MTRRISLFVLMLAGLAIVACSTSSDFVILNRSNNTIEVKYKWKRCTPGAPSSSHSDNMFPTILTIREFENSGNKWLNLDQESYENDGCTFIVNVRPGQALRLFQAYNYSDRDDEYGDFRFGIQDLTIAGRNGIIRLEGKQTQHLFKKVDTGNYVIEYQ